MLRGETVTINGDGSQTRDFVFVGDVVAANLAVTDDTRLTGPFNVGTGIETSVTGLHAALQVACGTHAGARHAPAKAGEQLRSVLDGSLLRTAARLPSPAALHEGLAETVAWFRQRVGEVEESPR
jgi:UDP-glucose 4-epimerase